MLQIVNMGVVFAAVCLLFCGLISASQGMKDLVVCERRKSSLTCPSGQVIKVVYANYGRTDLRKCPSKSIKTTTCFASGSSTTIGRSCNGRQSCSVSASNSVFGDPCKGTYKYLHVLYNCVRSAVKRDVVCEGGSKKLSCPGGLVLHIQSAVYGRADRNTCPSSSVRTTSCSARLSTRIVQGNCQHKQSCVVYASNSVYGDPCRGTYKYLSVSYSCIRKIKRQAVACENKPRTISCPSGKVIQVIYANYGRTDIRTCPSKSIKTIRCYAANSMAKVKASCASRRSCRLAPYNAVFGDPCYGTYKYLKVRYNCI